MGLQVATAYKNWTPSERRYQLLEKPAAVGSVLFRMARATVRSEPAPPAAPIEEAAEIALLTRYLDELKQVGEKELPLKTILAGKTSQQAATEMVHAGAAGVVPLAKAVDEAGKKVAKRRAETIDALEVSAAERIAQFRFRLFGAADYPDATATPRLTFGAVKGYRDRTEAPVPFATTFGGLFHFTAAQAPFLLPQRWTDSRAALGMVTPMDFVSTCDITSGPSGAPVVNQDGEIVGVTFDGNIESIAITYLYEDEKARAVHVASQGIVEALQKVYKATALYTNWALPPPGRYPLFDSDVRPLALLVARKMRNAVVDQAADPLQKLDARVTEVIVGGFGPQALQHGNRGGADETSRLMGVGLASPCMLFHGQLSFISTVRTWFSNLARLGERPAMETGRPMCRRSVPISTTSSSPFLNKPTSPLTAKGKWSFTW